MKKKIIVILSLITIFCFASSVSALVKPTEEFYINDYANILDSTTEEYILNHSASLASKTGAQLVVVTVPTLEGMEIEEYATTLFRNFGIGDKRKNNGLLILVSLKERKSRIEVGYGLEGILPDGLTGRYQDQYMIPYLKKNDWNMGIKNGYNAFYKKICEYYSIDATDISVTTTAYINTPNDLGIGSLVFCFISGLFFGFRVYSKKINRYSKTHKLGNITPLITLVILILNILALGYNYFVYKELFYIGITIEILMILLIGFQISFGSSYNSRHRSTSHRGFTGGGGSSGGGGSTRGF